MKQHYLVIDVELCFDCNNCFVACKDEYVDNAWPPYTEAQPRHGHRWMNIERTERGVYPRIDVAYRPTPCMHCEDAPCEKAHPEAVTRREDGIVLIDPDKARDKQSLTKSCPYGAIYWNDEYRVAQKCTMCAHLIDSGDAPCMPRCVHSCPTDAIKHYFAEPAEMEQKIKDENLEVFMPELDTKPHVFYKNYYLFDKAFIAGGFLKNGECVKDAEARLVGNGVDEKQVTDYFGDFKFDNLNPGEYTLYADGKEIRKVSVPKIGVTDTVALNNNSQNLGGILLD
jgi:Fe-S-cluster-containing dehydrogenase component